MFLLMSWLSLQSKAIYPVTRPSYVICQLPTQDSWLCSHINVQTKNPVSVCGSKKEVSSNYGNSFYGWILASWLVWRFLIQFIYFDSIQLSKHIINNIV